MNTFIRFQLLPVLFSLVCSGLFGQTLPSASAEGNGSTTLGTHTTVTGASISIDVTGGDKLLVVATFSSKTSSGNSTGYYRIADNSDANNVNSGDFALTHSGKSGIGTIVHIFDVSSMSGNQTYVFQHRTTANTLETEVTLTGILLYDGTNNLSASSEKLGSSIATDANWATVISESNFNHPSQGGIYVAASVQNQKTSGGSAVVSGEWKLQFKKTTDTQWKDMNYPIFRSPLGEQIGMVSLVGALPDGTEAGDYDFRVAHKRITGPSSHDLVTQECNLVVVSLGTSSGYFPVFTSTRPTASTTSTSLVPLLESIIIPQTNTKIFTHVQYALTSSGQTDPAMHDIVLKKGNTELFNSIDYKKFLANSTHYCSGSASALISGLEADSVYKLDFRHSSRPSRSLSTNETYMVVFGLYRSSQSLISPITVNASQGLQSSSYSTLKEAFDQINAGLFRGEITIHINHNTTEIESCILNASGVGNANYTSIQMYPTSTGLKISGQFASSLIHIRGAENVTIDGRVNLIGEADLTIENTEATNASARTLRFENSASNNIVRYCNILGSTPSVSAGVIFFSNSSSGLGNNNITIEHCNISNAGTRPSNLIYSAGTSGRMNKNIILRNNNIYNFLSGERSSNAVNIVSNSDYWTIEGNSFYDNDTIAPIGTYGYAVVRLNTSDANNYIVKGNYFGGQSRECNGGRWTIKSSLPHFLRIISVNSDNLNDLSTIEDNIFKGFDHTSTAGNPFDFIYVYSGKTNIIGNVIGDTSVTNSIILRAPSAYLTAEVSGGSVASVNIIGSGNGYATPPVISFSGGGGSGATATATINGNGEITGITVTNGGSGYTSSPLVRLDNVSHSYSTFHGIWLRNTADVLVNNNIVSSITTIGSDYYVYGFEGIYKTVGSTGATTISNNLIGSLTTANSIHVSSSGSIASDGQRVYGIYFQGANDFTATNNTIANITNSYSGQNNATATIGIYSNRGNANISNNNVFNIKTLSANTGGGSSASVFGIGISNTGSGLSQIISENIVSNIENINPSARVDAYGIFYQGSNATWGEVSANYVSDIKIHSTDIGSSIDGIVLFGGKINAHNNIVHLGKNLTSNVLVYGIFDQASWLCDLNLYFNTVFIEGNVTGTTSSSFAYFNNASSTTPRNVKNNIFVNTRNGGSSGKHYAIRLATMSSMTIDYNNYYAPSGVIGFLSVDRNTFAVWQSATSQDANSYNLDPQFAGTGSEHEQFFPTVALNGEPGTGVTVDYTGHDRDILTPKIGALEVFEAVWVGTTSTDFNTASNWSGGVVPEDGADIRFDTSPTNHCELDKNRVLSKITNSSDKDLVVNGKKLTVKGNIDFSGTGNIDATIANSCIEFAGIQQQTLTSSMFKSGTTDTLIIYNAQNVILNGNFIIEKQLKTLSGNIAIENNYLTINGSIDGTGILGGNTSSINIGGISASTNLPGMTLKTLKLNRPNGIQASGNITIVDTLSVLSGTLTLSGHSLTMQGNILEVTSGFIDASDTSDEIIFSNSLNITLPDGLFSDTINKLTINGAGLTSEGDLIIGNELNLAASNPAFDKGLLDMTNSKELTMCANSLTVGQGDVTGIVKRTSFLNNVKYSFGNSYTTISFLPGGTYPTFIKCKISIGTSPTWKTEAINRVYDFIQQDGVNCFATISTFYLDSELNGNIENDLSQWTYGDNGQQPAGAYDWGFSNYNMTQNWVEISNVNIGFFPTIFGNLENSLATTIATFAEWNGSLSTDWEDENNWTPNIIPDASSYVVIPDANTTPHSPTLPNNAEILKLWLHPGSVLNSGTTSTLIVNSNVSTWINSNGNFNPSTGTVIFSNLESNISGKTQFYNLIIPDTSTVWLTSDAHIQIQGTLTNNGTLRTVISGNTTVEYNGGNQTVVVPNAASNRYSTLILSGNGIKTLPSSIMEIKGNLIITEDATVSASGNLTIQGNCQVDSDAVFYAGAYEHIMNSYFIVDGEFNTSAGSKVIFSGSSHQYIEGETNITFKNLEINNNQHVQLLEAIKVDETLTLTSGDLILGGQCITVSGNISKTNGFIKACNYCCMKFTGTTAITLNDNLFDGTAIFSLLEINRTGGVTLGNQPITILDSLVLTAGNLLTADQTLHIGGEIVQSTGKIHCQLGSVINMCGFDEQIINDNLFVSDEVYDLHISNAVLTKLNSLLLVSNNLTVNPNAILKVAPEKAISINGDISCSGSFTLESSAAGNATLLNYGSINGNGCYNVEQYLSSNRNWYVSSPLNFSSTKTFDASGANQVWTFNETGSDVSTWWTEVNDDITNFNPMIGFIAKVNSSRNYTFSEGILNTGTLSLSNLTYTTTNPKVGYHLIGNPYPSYLNPTDALKDNTTGLEATIWYRTYDGSAYKFETYNYQSEVGTGGLTQNIPPMQSFWLRVTGPVNSIEFDNTMRNHKQVGDPNLKSNPANNLLRLYLTNANNKTDEAIILFNHDAGSGFNNWDSEKQMSSNVPQLWSMESGKNMVINSLPELFNGLTIPLFMNIPSAGSHSMGFNLQHFDNYTTVWLQDLVSGTMHDIRTGSYVFTNSVTSNSNRFVLVFDNVTTETDNNTAQTPPISIFNTEDGIYVYSLDEGICEVYDANGKIITHQQLNEGQTIMHLSRGLYLVRVTTNTVSKIQKVVIL